MLQRIIRIDNDLVRVPLLCLTYPFYYAKFVIKAWMPPSLGGHPNRKRLKEKDFYTFPLGLFFAALFGHFVEK